MPPLKYLLVTQIGRKKDGTHRIHHHILMNGGLDRDEVENLWWETKGTKDREPVMYGWANADRLRPNAKGIASMAGYMVQDSAGKKHWTQSQNLEKPWHLLAILHLLPENAIVTGEAFFEGEDMIRMKRRQLDKIAKLPEDSEEFVRFWEKQYRGWELVECEKSFNEQTGWYFYLTMRRAHIKQNGGLK